MSILFSSDHHFGHTNIIAYSGRPFEDVPGMGEQLVRLWNETVAPEDTVYYLGDFSIQPKYTYMYIGRLNGKIKWIPGNHDASHPMQKNHAEARKQLESYGVEYLGVEHTEVLDGIEFLMCHFPYGSEDHTYEARYPQWRPSANWNLPLLCGHVHELWKTKDRMINVGVDVWDYKPVALEQILEIVRK